MLSQWERIDHVGLVRSGKGKNMENCPRQNGPKDPQKTEKIGPIFHFFCKLFSAMSPPFPIGGNFPRFSFFFSPIFGVRPVFHCVPDPHTMAFGLFSIVYQTRIPLNTKRLPNEFQNNSIQKFIHQNYRQQFPEHFGEVVRWIR